MSVNNRHSKKAGFTLAEVLITLTIIGIVASSTIPVVIQDTQEATFRAAWKSTFSTLSQVTVKANLDYSAAVSCSYDDGCFDIYRPYLNLIVDTDPGDSRYPWPWHSVGDIRTLSGQIAPDYVEPVQYLYNGHCFMLNNGVTGTISLIEEWNGPVIRFIVDVNGLKKPNVIGKDIFAAVINYSDGDKTLHPIGIPTPKYLSDDSDINTACQKNSTDPDNTGWGCSTKYLRQ